MTSRFDHDESSLVRNGSRRMRNSNSGDSRASRAELLLANNAAIYAKSNVRLPADGLMLCCDSATVEHNGNTALHRAAWKNSLMADLLLASKAAVDVHIQDIVRSGCKWLYARSMF